MCLSLGPPRAGQPEFHLSCVSTYVKYLFYVDISRSINSFTLKNSESSRLSCVHTISFYCTSVVRACKFTENRQNTLDFELWPADYHVVVSFRQNTTPIFDPVKSQVSFPRKN